MAILKQAILRDYVTIHNSLAQNHTLSFKARGMMAYFLSLPDHWEIYVSQLEKICKEGRDAILSGLRELKEAGYIHHIKKSFHEGWTYLVFPYPVSADELKEFLRTNGFPNKRVSQQMANPQLEKKDSREKEKTIPVVTRTHAREEHVFTSEEEHQKLVSQYGEGKTQAFYKRLSDWKKDTPKSKWKKSDYRSILRWVVQAELDAEMKKQGNDTWKKKKFQNKSTNSNPTSSEPGTQGPISRTSASLADILNGLASG